MSPLYRYRPAPIIRRAIAGRLMWVAGAGLAFAALSLVIRVVAP